MLSPFCGGQYQSHLKRGWIDAMRITLRH
ncbi:hypothetical protein PSAC2689_120127 [Paraburkholderia sacchari]